MEDKNSIVRQHSGIWQSLRDGDFEEEEIWDVFKERADCSSGICKSKVASPVSVSRSLPTAARMIPRASISSSSSSSTSSSHEVQVLQQSAPVNIPDWSKIYGNKKKDKKSQNVSRFDDDVSDRSDENDEEEDDEYDDSKLPPHEVIARRLARSQISSFSVLEGIGRTLKGRDLSKVRNAILTKTGFLESP